MAIVKIQHRRGNYADYDPSKVLPGELVVTQADDPNSSDGEAVYIATTAGNVKRLAVAEELNSAIETALQDAIPEVVSEATQEAEAAADRAETAAQTLEIDTTLTKTNQAAEAKAVGDELTNLKSDLAQIVPGLSEEAKAALLACFEHVAWIDDDGQDYYDALEAALQDAQSVVSISAVFSQGTAKIYTADELDTLKQYLVVTATYKDGTTNTVTDYELTGTLSTGTSEISVQYSRKATTFNVVVSSGYRINGNKLQIRSNSQTSPYYSSSTNRLSYSDFDLLLSGGKTYLIEMDSDVTTANIGVQGFNQNVLSAVSNAQQFFNTDLYDPGWKAFPVTFSPPAKVNNSDFAGVRFTMRKDSNNSTITSNFVDEIRITEVD